MGFISKNKESMLGQEAAAAAAAGRRFFTPRLNTPVTQHGLSGSIRDWAEMIEAVEASGWQMVDWSVCTDNQGRPEAYPLFRRR